MNARASYVGSNSPMRCPHMLDLRQELQFLRAILNQPDDATRVDLRKLAGSFATFAIPLFARHLRTWTILMLCQSMQEWARDCAKCQRRILSYIVARNAIPDRVVWGFQKRIQLSGPSTVTTSSRPICRLQAPAISRDEGTSYFPPGHRGIKEYRRMKRYDRFSRDKTHD